MARNIPKPSNPYTGTEEVVRQSLYDFQAYAAAGQTSLSFFQVPVGQSSKTKADTNMVIAGSLPTPQKFMIQSIEIHFWPGGDISQFGAQAAAEYLNDIHDVGKGGFLELTVGSKTVLTEAPLLRFPPKTFEVYDAALTEGTTAAAASQSRIAYGRFGGKPYDVNPAQWLTSNVNFSVTLNWPAAVAIAATGRIGVVLDGMLYRRAQ
jgi:hypothetical protein